MASVSINAPSSDGTVTNYANVTGLSVLTATTSSSTSSTVSLEWIDNPLGYADGNSDRRNGGWIPRIPSDISLETNDGTVYTGGTYVSISIGLSPYMTQAHVTEILGSNGSKLSISGTAPHGVGSFSNSTANSSGVFYDVGIPGNTTGYTTSLKYYSSGAVIFRDHVSVTAGNGSGVISSGTTTANVITYTTTYTFTNNTGNPVTIESTEIADGGSAAVALVGEYFDITYTAPAVEEETEQTQQSQQTEETQQAEETTPTVFTGPYYVYATGATGFGVGLTGYFYPLYTDTSSTDLSNGFHVHTFTEYTGYTFYMPNGSMNHAVVDRPINVSKFVTGDPILDAIEPALLNPDYATLLAQIAAETDATKKASLENQAYRFVQPLTQEEQDLFGYINSGYIDENPSNTDGTPTNFLSYVGVYYDELGRNTGSDGQQIQVAVTSESSEQVASGTVAEYGIGEYGVNEYGG